MKILGQRIYIINDAALVQVTMRHTRSLSFEPIIIQASAQMFNVDDHVMKILGHTAPNNEPTYMHDLHTAMTTPLMPGPALYEMNARALECLGSILNGIGAEEQQKTLFGWIRDIFTEASAEALYGPENPVNCDRSLIDSLW